MNLGEYFGTRHGIGILASADADGRVDAAIDSRPHAFDDGSVAFVMRERLTHRNVGENPPAACLFIGESEPLGWIRLFLRKIREESDHPLIAAMIRPSLTAEEERREGARVPGDLLGREGPQGVLSGSKP